MNGLIAEYEARELATQGVLAFPNSEGLKSPAPVLGADSLDCVK